MTIWNVSTSAELVSALAAAQPLDEIVLADGNYGDLNIGGRQYADYVTIRGGHAAVFTGAWNPPTTSAAFVRLDGFTLDGGLQLSGLSGAVTHHIEVLNLAIGPVVGNDVMQIMGGVHDVLIQGCKVRDSISTDPLAHPDLIQMFRDFDTDATPANITIRRNLFWDDPGTGVIGAQGVFVSDGSWTNGYSGIVIEENVISPVLINALTLQSGLAGCALRNNLITSGRIWIVNNQALGNAGTVVEGNVSPDLLDDGGGATVQNNYTGEVSGYLPNLVDGSTLDQYRPAPGSPIEPYLGWLIAILDGQPQVPPMDFLTIIAVRVVSGPVTAIIVGTPGQPDHDIEIAPNDPNYVGAAIVEYDAQDTEGFTSTATVTVNFTGTPPVLADDNVGAPKGTTVRPAVLVNDVA
jgi:hypothetical protein